MRQAGKAGTHGKAATKVKCRHFIATIILIPAVVPAVPGLIAAGALGIICNGATADGAENINAISK